jgi:hypothetical protein
MAMSLLRDTIETIARINPGITTSAVKSLLEPIDERLISLICGDDTPMEHPSLLSSQTYTDTPPSCLW